MTHSNTKNLFESLIQEENVQNYLDSLKDHHKETYEHALRTSQLCIDLGYINKASETDLRLLGYAGLLHDIGKTKIPKEILSKGSPLNPSEREIIEEHSRLVFQELKEPEFETVKQIIVAHHEYKINPYPRKGADRRKIPRSTKDRRKTENDISILAQMLAVADIYDALESKRPYKHPLPKEKIRTILEEQFTGDKKYIDQIIRKNKRI